VRRLIVIRHGKAFKESPTGLDADRVLHPRGERQAAWLAEAITGLDPRPTLVLSSPFARAKATAAPIARALGLAPRLERALEAERSLQPVVELITRQSVAALVIVGHNFQLSDLVGLLVEGIGRRTVELRTGQAAVLRLDPDLRPGKSSLEELIRCSEDED
jgi:phosphohistidine phosphatase